MDGCVVRGTSILRLNLPTNVTTPCSLQTRRLVCRLGALARVCILSASEALSLQTRRAAPVLQTRRPVCKYYIEFVD